MINKFSVRPNAPSVAHKTREWKTWHHYPRVGKSFNHRKYEIVFGIP